MVIMNLKFLNRSLKLSNEIATSVIIIEGLLILMLLFFSSTLVYAGFLVHKVFILIFYIIGAIGIIQKNRYFSLVGKIGCWYFFIYSMIASIPDEEYYMMNNISLPEKSTVILNFIFSVAVSIFWFLLLCLERNEKKVE